MTIHNIFLIEDNYADALFAKRILQKMEPALTLEHHSNGDDAWARLQDVSEEDQYPDLILLDLNLPGLSGHELLERIRSEESTRNLPVLVLSSSSYSPDVERAYSLGANAYLTKASRLNDARAMFESIVKFWLKQATLL